MTIDEAIQRLVDVRKYNKLSINECIALGMAITALEQDTVPFDFELYQAGLMDIPQGMIDVLDNIKAEIIENSIEDYIYHGCGSDELIIDTNEVLKIIDKYKANPTGVEGSEKE